MDQTTLAYINMYAVLGAIPALTEHVPLCAKILGKSSAAICFSVKNGPCATLFFRDGRCTLREDEEDCTIKLPFSSPEKFNGMIAGTVTPVPTKGITQLPFLLGKFKKITDLLEMYLRPAGDKLSDEKFMRKSTLIMFGVIVRAAAQIANHDKIGRFSASNMVDGVIKIEVENEIKAALSVKGHTLSVLDKIPRKIMSYMSFCDLGTARAVFDGKMNSVAAVGEGKIRMGGMISQIDNLNRLLSRVEIYLK